MALRVDPRHVGRLPRRHHRLGAHVPRPLRLPARAHLAPPARSRGARLPAAAGVRRRLAAAREDADRAPVGRHRRPRQGGADRRGGRRRAADGTRDAAKPAAPLHPDRLRRRRPAQARRPHPRHPRARHRRRPDAPPARQPTRRGADRDPLGPGLGAPADRRDVRRRGRARQDAPRAARADLRRPRPRRADPPRPGRGRARAAAGRGRPAAHRRLREGEDGARHRRRRVDRVGDLPAALPARRRPPDPRREERNRALRHRAGARRGTRLRRRDPGARQLLRPRQDAAGLRAVRAAGAVPRRRLQARRHARVQSAAGGREQHPRHAESGRGGDRGRGRALRADLHRQGREPEERDGAVEGGLRVDRRVVGAARRRRDALRRRPVRQRPRLVRLRDPDLPPPDRARRPGDGARIPR